MTWYGEREMPFCPKHFIETKTALTDESKQWILEKLTGRFFVTTDDNVLFFNEQYPYFEDRQEAILYELTWG